MKHFRYLLLIITTVCIGCGNNDQKLSESQQSNSSEGTEATQSKTKVQYGKIQRVDITPEIDKDMAKHGLRIFDVTCTSCHKYDERYVGPALGDVTKRRTPEFIMNMILDTETMIEKDDTVKCLLQTYLLKMPNMQVDEKDARSVLEHLREKAQ